MLDIRTMIWRVGRHVPIHFYAQVGSEPSNEDFPLGTALNIEIAEELVSAHNLRFENGSWDDNER